jgi:hypothetical protein
MIVLCKHWCGAVVRLEKLAKAIISFCLVIEKRSVAGERVYMSGIIPQGLEISSVPGVRMNGQLSFGRRA